MKKLSISLCLIFLSIALFSQDTTKQAKNRFSFKIGGSYRTSIDNKYEQYPKYIYENITKSKTSGLSFGVLYNIGKNWNWQFTTGFVYYLRNDNYKNYPNTIRDYSWLTKYYVNNDIELPLMMQYKFWKISLSAGINLTLLNYRIATYTYENNYYPKITLRELEIPLTIYPTFYVSYDLKINNISFKPFIGFDVYRLKFSITEDNGLENSLFIHGGVIIPLKYK